MNTLISSFSKTRPVAFRLLLNLVLALLIFYNAEIGRLLGIKSLPLAISVVWPASGFALAAVLLFGFRNCGAGIFLGYFCYNFFHLYSDGNPFTGPLLAALSVTAGSTLQAFVGGYVFKRYASTEHFMTVRDVLIFLIPAGLLTCTIASTVGVTTLYLYGVLQGLGEILQTWVLYWIGDTMGVYVFTPLFIIWSIQKPIVPLSRYPYEAFFMLVAFIILSLLTSIWGYRLWHLFLPLALWITYRFRMHGATLAIFFISLVIIIPFSLGYEYLAPDPLGSPLVILVSFLEIMVVTTLLVAAIINEREAAFNLIQLSNKDLKQVVDIYADELQFIQNEDSIKAKFAFSLDLLAAGITRHLGTPLKMIEHFSKAGLDSIKRIQSQVSLQHNKLAPHDTSKLQNECDILADYLHNIENLQMQGSRIAQIIQVQSLLTLQKANRIKSIPLNTVIEASLTQAVAEAASRYPDFTFSTLTTFDKDSKMVMALPEDLAYAFILLFSHSIDTMKIKKDLLGAGYLPVLEVESIHHESVDEVLIRDNGYGTAEEKWKYFFQSFILPTSPGISIDHEMAGLALTVAHDIIVHVHRAEAKVSAVNNDFSQFSLFFPSVVEA